MHSHISRRDFLKTAGTAASIAILSQACICPRYTKSTYLRRDIVNLSTGDQVIMSYRAAVKAMRSLHSDNPLSWDFQAGIHGSDSMNPNPAWNQCEHHTDFFWSWHRMYLYWFERIVRKMSNDNSWALPFWNWSSKVQRQIPAAFRDTTSELYTINRDPAMNDGSGSLPEGDVDYSFAFNQTDFSGANDFIQNPHDNVHIDTGGWMGRVPTAAQDPLFFVHHSNVDRLWNLWLAQGKGRTDPVADTTWTGKTYNFFDENGRQVQMTGCDVLRAAQQLDYAYECEPKQVREFCGEVKVIPVPVASQTIFNLPIPPELTSENVSMSVSSAELREKVSALGESKTNKLVLNLENVEADRQPGAVWEVYFGLPLGTAPKPKGPFFVGTLSLFGTGVRSDTHHEFKPARFTFPLDRAIAAALKSRADRVQIVFVPHGVLVYGKPSRPKVQSPVRIGAANIAVRKTSD